MPPAANNGSNHRSVLVSRGQTRPPDKGPAARQTTNLTQEQPDYTSHTRGNNTDTASGIRFEHGDTPEKQEPTKVSGAGNPKTGNAARAT